MRDSPRFRRFPIGRFRPRLPASNAPWFLLVIVVLLVARFVGRWDSNRADARLELGGPRRVVRVVDGDTLLLEGNVRVRLIGVDTPETKHPTKPVDPLGLEAADFTRRWVEGRDVALQFDRERRDRYGRTLAYVYPYGTTDGPMLNEELIRAGYSRAETRFHYSRAMAERFRRAEAEARKAGRGMWAAAN